MTVARQPVVAITETITATVIVDCQVSHRAAIATSSVDWQVSVVLGRLRVAIQPYADETGVQEPPSRMSN